jgi:hypothetical protein
MAVGVPRLRDLWLTAGLSVWSLAVRGHQYMRKESPFASKASDLLCGSEPGCGSLRISFL